MKLRKLVLTALVLSLTACAVVPDKPKVIYDKAKTPTSNSYIELDKLLKESLDNNSFNTTKCVNGNELPEFYSPRKYTIIGSKSEKPNSYSDGNRYYASAYSVYYDIRIDASNRGGTNVTFDRTLRLAYQEKIGTKELSWCIDDIIEKYY